MALELYEKIERTRHFGELFLIWLWFRSSVDDTIFTLSDGCTLALAIDNQMTLEAKLAEAEKTVLSGGAPADSKEAYEGLRQGKVVSQAKLRVQRDEKEWVFVLNAATMTISSLKIPSLMTKETDNKFFERQALIEEIDGLLRGLYEKFLSIRLNPKAWKQENQELCDWITEKL